MVRALLVREQNNKRYVWRGEVQVDGLHIATGLEVRKNLPRRVQPPAQCKDGSATAELDVQVAKLAGEGWSLLEQQLTDQGPVQRGMVALYVKQPRALDAATLTGLEAFARLIPGLVIADDAAALHLTAAQRTLAVSKRKAVDHAEIPAGSNLVPVAIYLASVGCHVVYTDTGGATQPIDDPPTLVRERQHELQAGWRAAFETLAWVPRTRPFEARRSRPGFVTLPRP